MVSVAVVMVAGQTVVETTMVSVVREVAFFAGQLVTVGAQEVMVLTVVE